MTIDFAVNPMTEEFRTHSGEYYSRLLKERPVARTELDQWLFCRYADVKRILTDHDNFQRPSDWSIERKPEGPLREFGKNNMVGMNPPKHTRFRQSAARGFSSRTVHAMEPAIQRLVDKLLDDMVEKESGDFIQDFAFPLPVWVICEMMGISHEDHGLFGQPERFDIRRENARQHLSFAAGRNLCLGHNLARLEGKIAFPRLFKKLGNFQLAGDPVPRNGLMFKGYYSLPMSWQAV